MARYRKIEKSPLFRGLHFKFAAAFVGVTLLAWFVTLMVTGMFDYQNTGEDMKSVANYERAQKQSVELLDYLEPESRNPAAVRWWLEAYRTKIILHRRAHAADLYYFSSPEVEALDNSVYLRVNDADGNVIAVNRTLAEATTTDFYDVAESNLWAKLKAGETDGRNLTASHADGAVSMVVPLRDAKTGNLRGALWLREKLNFTTLSLLQKLISDFLSDSQAALAFLILFSVLLGFPLALYLSRRLNRIALAAHSWSQGDFTVRAADRSPDELGILAKRLNEMAKDLSRVFALKQELAASEERNRIARDLHDSVKQQVFGLAMQINAAAKIVEREESGGRVQKQLAEAKKLAQQVQKELVGIIQELRPQTSDGKTFDERVSEYAADWSRQNAVAAKVEAAQISALPLPIENTLFRIVQETLANTARHARARQVSIRLQTDQRQQTITLTIADDGQGFETNQPPTGFGLQNICERAESLPHGHCSIESEIGKGSTVTVSCRFEIAEENAQEEKIND